MTIPQTLPELSKKLDSFKSFLESRDFDILPPTNEWEVLRYLHPPEGITKTSVIYKNKKGILSYSNMSKFHFEEFLDAEEDEEKQ